jgi:putative tryptophan/tyrosine transport system substrate-binding protein
VIGRRRLLLCLASAMPWPLAAPAQPQPERMRRLGGLFGGAPDDPEGNAQVAVLQDRLRELGWIEGRNLRMEFRFAAGNAEAFRRYAAELATMAPDVILTTGAGTAAMLQTSRALPVVFAFAIDAVGSGFVETLSKPGGNVTGFMLFEFSLNAKWVELLKEIAPDMRRTAVLRGADSAVGVGQFAVIQSAASTLNIEVTAIDLRDVAEIEQGVAHFARSGNGGLIVTAHSLANVHRELIVTLAARHRLPAIYFDRRFVDRGGLISLGANLDDQIRRAASYVDRVLRGEKPSDLPVQAPVRYELVVNRKTADALGLTVPPGLLARADEVIE